MIKKYSKQVVCVSVMFFWLSIALAQLNDSLRIALYKLAPQNRLSTLVDMARSSMRSNPLVAAQLFETALPISDSLNKPIAKLEILNELGSVYLQQDDYATSQTYLDKAVKMASRIQADTLLIDTYTYLGILLERTKKYEDALDFLQKAGALQQKLQLGPESRARNLTNIGHVYEEQGLYEKAIVTYQIAYDVSKDNGIFFGEALLSQNLANVHNAIGKYQESIDYSQKSLAIARQQNLPRIITAAYQNLGASYLAMGQFGAATAWYQKALQEALPIKYTKALLDIQFQLSKCYEKQGQLDLALDTYKAYTSLKDSIFSAEKIEKIEALQAAFQFEQKEAAIKSLQQANMLSTLRQQRTNVGIIAFVIVLLVAGLFIYQKIKQDKKYAAQQLLLKEVQQLKQTQQLERDKTLYELNALKAQMNPHFLFNALNSIQELFVTGQQHEANEFLAMFSDLTRTILDASGKQLIRLDEELHMLNNYLALEGLRFGEEFSYDIDVPDSVTTDLISLPPMLVQPYVENSIKHGLMHKAGAKRLKIAFTLSEQQGILEVTVQDNGIGRQKAAYFASLRNKKHKSFGSSASEKRLALLNSSRHDAITVQYTDLMEANEPCGTRVVLQIPIETLQ